MRISQAKERELQEQFFMPEHYCFLMQESMDRNGVASIFLEVEALGGRRAVKITHTRTRVDWAHFIKEMLEERYPQAQKVVLVMDNLNTHGIASLYTAFSPKKARSLAQRLEILLESYNLSTQYSF